MKNALMGMVALAVGLSTHQFVFGKPVDDQKIDNAMRRAEDIGMQAKALYGTAENAVNLVPDLRNEAADTREMGHAAWALFRRQLPFLNQWDAEIINNALCEAAAKLDQADALLNAGGLTFQERLTGAQNRITWGDKQYQLGVKNWEAYDRFRTTGEPYPPGTVTAAFRNFGDAKRAYNLSMDVSEEILQDINDIENLINDSRRQIEWVMMQLMWF